MKEKKMAIKFSEDNFTSPDSYKLNTLYKVTDAKIGIDNKKDIFADSSLLNPKILAAEIVMPDLLTPGISDNI